MLFLLDTQYSAKGDLEFVFYDDTSHSLKRIKVPNDHLPYLLTEDFSKIKGESCIVKTELINKYDPTILDYRKLFKVCVKEPRDIYDKYRNTGIRLKLDNYYEGDIEYYLCYVYDKKFIFGVPYSEDLTPIYGTGLISSCGEKLKDCFIQLFSNVLSAPILKSKFVVLDIEVKGIGMLTGNYTESILCCSLISNDGIRKVLTLTPEKFIFTKEYEYETFDNEKDLIKRVFYFLNTYPFVITFAGDNGDLEYIKNRAKQLGISEEEIPITTSVHKKVVVSELNSSIHIDLLKLFGTGILTYALPSVTLTRSLWITLDEIGKKIVGLGKLPQPDFNKIDESLLDYCFRDSLIVYKVFEETSLLELLILLSRIYNFPIRELTRSRVSWLNEVLFKYMHRYIDFLIPRQEYFIEKSKSIQVPLGKGGKYEGAIISAEPGTEFDIQVCDFRGLYPTVIDKRNISYETINCGHEECVSNKVPGLGFHICKKYEGIVKAYIGALCEVRKFYKLSLNDKNLREEIRKVHKLIVGALKIGLLTHYGTFAQDTSYLYMLAIAASIAAYGRDSIMKATDLATKNGFHVKYVHTDGMLISKSELMDVNELVNEINKSGIEIEHEKDYRYVVIPARANYLGILPDGNPDIKGLMGKKRDICIFLKNVFDSVVKELSQVLSKEDFVKARENVLRIIETSVKELKERKFKIEDLAFRILLNKEIMSGKGQFYEAARQCVEYGIKKEVGDYIYIVLTKGRYHAKSLELVRLSEVDTNKYIERMEGILKQIVIPLGIDFKEILQPKHISLDKFKQKGIMLDFRDSTEGLEKWM